MSVRITRPRHRYAVITRCAALCVALTVALAGCTSPLGLPMHGAVQTMSPIEQRTRRVFTDPQGPQTDAQPEGIVEGFFDAIPAGVQNDGFRVARQFLTTGAARLWKGGASATIFTGAANFTRKANTFDTPTQEDVIIEADLQVVGTLDGHGLYQPADSSSVQPLSFTLTKTAGQWRIAQLPDGVIISDADYDRAFRQVSLYQVDAAGKTLIPDVRWLSWRNWRTRAVEELLEGSAAWIAGVATRTNTEDARLAVDSVPVEDGKAHVQLNDAFNQIDDHNRALLVRQIRLTLSDGSDGSDLVITAGTSDYSQADADVSIDYASPTTSMYSLSAGHIVSLGSASPLRVGETGGFSDARGFTYTPDGGAVLRADSQVECLKADGSSCGVMFNGARLQSITGGLNTEIWGLGEDGRTIFVSSRNGDSVTIPIPGSDRNRVSALAVSPEGSRVAFAVDSGPLQGVVVAGVVRQPDQRVVSLNSVLSQVSRQRDVNMLTFYNDVTLVYAQASGDDRTQRAFRQLVPGPEQMQKLPSTTVVGLSAGQIAMNRRLAVVDSLGIVRSMSGSLDGSWSIADSQVTAISSR